MVNSMTNARMLMKTHVEMKFPHKLISHSMV